ncbi:hypothetical protein RRG08_046958 [Elysia crispata]|uniref:Uncharacterized protein n=1 Tax=Elysia crispata TaxID=231223 RepID=A0AAE1DU99_9GAST|nr:hypothetical protein RRG08_046958 [Elysia crispata]
MLHKYGWTCLIRSSRHSESLEGQPLPDHLRDREYSTDGLGEISFPDLTRRCKDGPRSQRWYGKEAPGCTLCLTSMSLRDCFSLLLVSPQIQQNQVLYFRRRAGNCATRDQPLR